MRSATHHTKGQNAGKSRGTIQTCIEKEINQKRIQPPLDLNLPNQLRLVAY